MATKRSNAGYHHGRLKEAVLEAAASVIADHGLDALKLRSLGRDLGVSHTAITYHFGDRQALLESLALSGFESLRAAFEAVGPRDDPADRLLALGQAYVTFARRHPGQFRVMFGRELVRPEGMSASLNAASERAFRAFAEAIPNDDASGERLLTAWALAHGIASLVVQGPLPERAGDALDDWIRGAMRRGAEAAVR